MKKCVTFLIFVLLPLMGFAQSYSQGDVNHDGNANIVDALMIAQYSVGITLSGFYTAQADVNCTASIDITDALLVAQYSVGIVTQFKQCQTSTPIITATPTPTAGPTANSGLPAPSTNNIPKPNGTAGNLQVINWAGFKGSVSYTFDDANSSQISNFTALNNLGVRFTFYLQTNKSEASNTIWATALKSGHELGNHTQSHPQTGSGSDIDACTTFIQQHFGVTPLTMAAPYGDNSYVSLAQSRFLFNRGVAGGDIAANSSTNQWNLNCNIPASGASASAMTSTVSSARSSGHWTIMLVHGFTGGSDGAYQPVAIGEFTSSVNQVKAFGDMWIDSVINVGAYWIGQKLITSASPTTSGSDKTWTWTLPAHFPTGKYVRVKVDGGTLKQKGVILPWDSHGYYEVSLDAGSLTLSP